ncbi:hypothetical protein PFFVO_03772 [Plasmodium falciparum Vietnam Oak-Knoll (FVO)]|uniref:Uncharacterized protein n=1 Tax=Plasmodium falciparum Vietnam Oak-Knoll (FVO) TaxID=1036723 RepID=A0A024V551_PLAFA|nr:hypothetical protein PFFVO_03772 [Plasmodium falciparum Vietnam Oak-Knoll (FVO)]
MKIMKKKSATKNKKSYNINRKKIKEADFYKIEGFSYKKIKNCVYHFYKVQFINYKYTAIYKTFK